MPTKETERICIHVVNQTTTPTAITAVRDAKAASAAAEAEVLKAVVAWSERVETW